MLRENFQKQSGATMVEYAFMVSLIAIISYVIVSDIGQETKKPFNAANSSFTSAQPG